MKKQTASDKAFIAKAKTIQIKGSKPAKPAPCKAIPVFACHVAKVITYTLNQRGRVTNEEQAFSA